MNLSVNGLNGFSVFSQGFGVAGMLKSTQEKIARQQKAQSQIQFFENQKENLKNMQCDSIEDIAKKLEMFHSYEDQIAAIKKQYNNEQMLHAMDEAWERGEKIAEHAEDNTPKTEEERKEEMVEETLGIEEQGGLTESMEEAEELTEELKEKLTEELTEEVVEEMSVEDFDTVNESVVAETEMLSEIEQMSQEAVQYKRIDILI